MWPTSGFAVACLTVWTWANIGYSQKSKENMKDLVPLTRGAAYPEYLKAPDHPLLAGVFTDIDVYDPLVQIIRNEQELDALITKATLTGRKLYVTHGLPAMMKSLQSGILTRLGNHLEFSQLAVSRGLESPQFTHFVYVWAGKQPGSSNKLAVASNP